MARLTGTKPGEPPQLFALNDEAFENFAHKSYKKVRDAAVALMRACGNRRQNCISWDRPKAGAKG
jgi:feruloyl esterase